MILPLPNPVVVVTRTSVALLGGTAAQATALAKSPAFSGWTVISLSAAVSDKPPAGAQLPSAEAVRAAWDGAPTLSLRLADLEAGTLGSLAPSDPPFPSLALAGGDPTLGVQLRFRRDSCLIACPSADDAAALVAAFYGARGPNPVTVGRWDAALQTLTPWGAATVSSTWPKP